MRLRCNRVGVTFSSSHGPVNALEDVDFETREGEFVSIIGPSGCGKTTLLRAIAGLLPGVQGSVERIPGSRDTSDRSLLVFQENSLFPWMTVMDNATFGLAMQGVPRAEREERARELLSRFGLKGRERAWPHQLSVGMKQRVAVIRCFLSDPALLLMDEPFGALDALTRIRLQQELLSLWEQNHKTVIFITHDVDEAILLSDRVMVMSPAPGRLIAQYPIRFERPRDSSIVLSPEFVRLKQELHSRLGVVLRQAAAVV